MCVCPPWYFLNGWTEFDIRYLRHLPPPDKNILAPKEVPFTEASKKQNFDFQEKGCNNSDSVSVIYEDQCPTWHSVGGMFRKVRCALCDPKRGISILLKMASPISTKLQWPVDITAPTSVMCSWESIWNILAQILLVTFYKRCAWNFARFSTITA
jgi:hypothetical protein